MNRIIIVFFMLLTAYNQTLYAFNAKNKGQSKVYKDEYLTSIEMPVGGIGSGSIRMDGQGKKKVWSIFNNKTQAFVPNSFFAVRASSPDVSEPVVRVLQTEAVGPFAAMDSLSFIGEYPFAWYKFCDKQLPVDIELEVFNPLIPLELKKSSIPCAVFNITAINNTDKPVEISFLGTQQNCVGYTGIGEIRANIHSDYGANVNKILDINDGTALHMTSKIPSGWRGWGDMSFALLSEDVESSANWKSLDELYQSFLKDGVVLGPQEAESSQRWTYPHNQTIDGALSTSFVLNPGTERKVSFFLTWYFPNGNNGDLVFSKWDSFGNMYCNIYKDSLDVLLKTRKDWKELDRLTRLYHDSLYDSTLPHYLLDRLANQAAVLRSPTCFWSRKGFFGAWEGLFNACGSCMGNCTHVWQYAQLHARLFPKIDRMMRKQEFDFMSDDGAIPFRLGRDFDVAFDGHCGTILSSLRCHLISEDNSWLSDNWVDIKKALEYIIKRWDEDEDGIARGPQHNTADASLTGNSSWLGSLYLSALAAGEQMAAIINDPDASRYASIYSSGMKIQDKTLYNGEYYIQLIETSDGENYGNGCHVDQLLGQYWACQLNLGWLYPEQRVVSSMQSVMKYNYKTNFKGIHQNRRFVDDNDAGMLLTTWPYNDRPEKCIRYADEVWSGNEYSVAALMMYASMPDEALKVIKTVADRYDGRNRQIDIPYKLELNANPFSDNECGMFYARPLSIWSVLLASQGFIYDGPKNVLGFKPNYEPENHKSFFSTATGWGNYEQDRSTNTQRHKIALKYGRLKIKNLIFDLPNNTRLVSAKLVGNKSEIEFSSKQEAQEIKIVFGKPILLKENQAIELHVIYEGK